MVNFKDLHSKDFDKSGLFIITLSCQGKHLTLKQILAKSGESEEFCSKDLMN